MNGYIQARFSLLRCLVLLYFVGANSETVDDRYVTVEKFKMVETQLLDINRNINDKATEQAEIINKQNIEITDLKQRIAEQDIKIANQDSELAALEARIANQDVSIANQDTKIVKQEVFIANQNVKIASEDVKIADQDTKIAIQDATIAKLLADITVADVAKDSGCCNVSFQDVNVQLKRIASAVTSTGQYPNYNEVNVMLQNLTDRIGNLENIGGLETFSRAPVEHGGAVYIRWGRTTCPENGTNLVYKGQAGGSSRSHSGAAANALCLPDNPSWARYNDATTNHAYVYGSEIATDKQNVPGSTVDHKYHGHDIPCCVCRSRGRLSVLMIPGRNTCDQGWKLEYKGYLMAGRHTHQAASEYVCMDEEAERMHGGHERKWQHIFYSVEAQCGALRCPPYVNGRELTCAVCTK